MTSKLALVAAMAALITPVALPALSHAALPGLAPSGPTALVLPEGTARGLILADHDEHDDDDDEHGWGWLFSGGDDDDECGDDDERRGDDDDGARGCGAAPQPAGSAPPPDNGLFENGTAPTAKTN